MSTKEKIKEGDEMSDNKYVNLSKYFDAIVNKDNEAASTHYAAYVLEKSKDIRKAILEDSDAALADAEVDTDEDEDEDEDYNKMLKTRNKMKAPLKKMKRTDEAAKVDDVSDSDESDEDEDEDEDYSKKLKTRTKMKTPLKKMKKMDESTILKEFTGEDSPIRLKGDDVFIDGKMVGTITNDLSNIDAGILFTSTDGTFKQEFESIKDLYAFLVQHFEVHGEAALDTDEE